MMLRSLLLSIFICAGSGACTQAPVSTTPPDAGSPGSDQGAVGGGDADWAAIVKLENEAKAIAKVSGCASSECRAAAVGARACGGPRYYIPYCAKTTDSVALYAKLDEVAKAERAYNVKHQIASTCEFRMPPIVESVGGSCVAR